MAKDKDVCLMLKNKLLSCVNIVYRHCIAIRWTVAAAVLFSGIGLLSFHFTIGTAQAADIISSTAALVAIWAAFLVVKPRLRYRLLPRALRRSYVKHLENLIVLVTASYSAFAESGIMVGRRTDALSTVHVATTTLGPIYRTRQAVSV